MSHYGAIRNLNSNFFQYLSQIKDAFKRLILDDSQGLWAVDHGSGLLELCPVLE